MARRRPRQTAFQRYMAMSDYLAPVPRNILQREARLNVQSQINPILKQIQNAFARRTTAGVGEIQNRQTAGVKIAGEVLPQVQQQYGQQVAAQENINRGMTELVRSTGGRIIGDLQSKLNRPEAAAPAQEAINANVQMSGGFGGSSMSRLVAQQAAGTNWAAALPAMRKMQGQAEQGAFRKELRGQQQEAEGDLRGQIPGLVRSTYESLLDKQMQAAIAREGFGIDRAQLKAQTQSSPTGPSKVSTSMTKLMNDGNAYDSEGNVIPGLSVPINPGGPGKTGSTGAKTGPGSKAWQGRVDKTRNEVKSLIQTYYNRENPLTGLREIGPYRDASAATIARWRGKHPGMPLDWIRRNAQLSLVEGGYRENALNDPNLQPGGAKAAKPGKPKQKATVATGPGDRGAATGAVSQAQAGRTRNAEIHAANQKADPLADRMFDMKWPRSRALTEIAKRVRTKNMTQADAMRVARGAVNQRYGR